MLYVILECFPETSRPCNPPVVKISDTRQSCIRLTPPINGRGVRITFDPKTKFAYEKGEKQIVLIAQNKNKRNMC